MKTSSLFNFVVVNLLTDYLSKLQNQIKKCFIENINAFYMIVQEYLDQLFLIKLVNSTLSNNLLVIWKIL